MKKCTVNLFVFFVLISLLSETVITTNALGAEGYAIYKDEVFGTNYSWHAGLMDEENTIRTLPVLHLKSASSTFSDGGAAAVSYDTCSNFINGANISRYYYTSNDRPDTDELEDIRDKARELRLNSNSTSKIYTYHFFRQIMYNIVPGQTKVYPDDITGFRCDGVVEYVYEYYGHRIYGNDTYWDISTMGENYRNQHTTARNNWIHPKYIAENYMTAAHIIGDVDGNGTVSADDSRLAQRYSVGLEDLFDFEIARADVDFDGSITASDARTILRIATGLE